jgi:hypothetical protein
MRKISRVHSRVVRTNRSTTVTKKTSRVGRKTVGSVCVARYGAPTIHTACRAATTTNARDGHAGLERREDTQRDLLQDSGYRRAAMTRV